NVLLNRVSNVEVTRLALAGHTGQARLFHNTNSGTWGHTITLPVSGRGEDVPADTLTNFLAQQKIAFCHFLKFNCEGAEFPILLGTPAHVLRRVGVMLVLYHCDLALGYRHTDLIAHLEAAGFSTAIRHQGRNRGW